MGLIVMGILGHTFFLPWLKTVPRPRALMILVAPHAFRYFAITGFEQSSYNPDLPMAWAQATAIADFATCLAAIVALIALSKRSSIGIPFVWVCNLIGLYAYGDSTLKMMTMHVPVHLLYAVWFLAVFWVPLLMWSHILLCRELLGKRSLTAG
jgi:hypothetical protein